MRMFEYFYKIYDKYKVPITAIAILADENRSYRPALYRQEFMGTELTYKFNSYKIIEQSEEALRADSNPFAVVALTALMAIKHKHSDDEQLKGIKLDLYNEMMKRKMERSDQEMLRIFEEEIEIKQGRSTTVGTREYLLEKAKNEGIMLERSKTEKLVETKSYEFVRNLILESSFDDAKIAQLAIVSITFVQKVHKELAKKRK